MTNAARRITISHFPRVEYATRRIIGPHVASAEFKAGLATCLIQFDGRSIVRAFWSGGEPDAERHAKAFDKALRDLIRRAA